MATLAEYESRRERLLQLMGQYRVSCRELAEMMDRKPQTVRCWRNGSVPLNDHTLAVVELGLALRSGDLVWNE